MDVNSRAMKILQMALKKNAQYQSSHHKYLAVGKREVTLLSTASTSHGNNLQNASSQDVHREEMDMSVVSTPPVNSTSDFTSSTVWDLEPEDMVLGSLDADLANHTAPICLSDSNVANPIPSTSPTPYDDNGIYAPSDHVSFADLSNVPLLDVSLSFLNDSSNTGTSFNSIDNIHSTPVEMFSSEEEKTFDSDPEVEQLVSDETHTVTRHDTGQLRHNNDQHQQLATVETHGDRYDNDERHDLATAETHEGVSNSNYQRQQLATVETHEGVSHSNDKIHGLVTDEEYKGLRHGNEQEQVLSAIEKHQGVRHDNATNERHGDVRHSDAAYERHGLRHGNDQAHELVTAQLQEGTRHVQASEDERAGRKRKRLNMKEINKNKRARGEQYMGRKYDANTKTYVQEEKPARKMGERCGCKSKCTKCGEVSDEERNIIFQEVWLMSWPPKQVFVASLSEIVDIKRRTTDKEDSRRHASCKYHLKVRTKTVPVCKKMFLSTTGLTDYFVRTHASGAKGKESHAFDVATSSAGFKKRHSASRDGARSFLRKLPTLPSHYCRKSSSKNYLEPVFNSYCQLYRFYCEDCRKNDVVSVSRQIFMEEFRQANLEIFHPRKDQCDTCVGYKNGNVAQDIYNRHRLNKQKAQEEKSKDKENASQSNGKITVITMDLQSVLLAPLLKASALYYRTKLCVHNFTMFDCVTKEGTCYVWHEADGGLTANEFASCVLDFLTSKAETDRFILYSDGCTYQNRNVMLSRALTYFSQKSGKEIEQKILEKGHTQMEADSVHSTIERHIKDKDIFCPADYVRLFRSARTKPFPYEVKYLDFTFFRDFSQVCTMKSIRPGKKAGEPHVVDLRALQYHPDGRVLYKLDHDGEWMDLPLKRSETTTTVCEPPLLYSARRKIPSAKYTHLQELKSVIPSDYHGFYDQLPHD